MVFLKYLLKLQKQYNFFLLGGDISKSSELSISANFFGKAKSNNILSQNKCSLGDDIWMTGNLGNSYLGYKIYKNLKLKVSKNSIKVSKGSKLKSTSLSTSPYPGFPTDLQAQLMSLMCISDGKSKIKETIFENRMNHVDLLNQMGSSITLKDNIAHINGVKKLRGMTLVGLALGFGLLKLQGE